MRRVKPALTLRCGRAAPLSWRETMDWTWTGILGFGALALAVLAGWLGARPTDLKRGPSLVPWRLIMVLAGTVAILMAAHALNLLGVQTGR